MKKMKNSRGEFLDLKEFDMSSNGVCNDLLPHKRDSPFWEIQPENLIDADITSRVKVILGSDKEMLLKTVIYLENINKVMLEEELEENIISTEEWRDSNFQLPIIHLGEVQSTCSSSLTSKKVASPFFMEEEVCYSDILLEEKYWYKQVKGPIILHFNIQELQWCDINSDILSRFPQNSRIYVLVTGCICTAQEDYTLPSKLTIFSIETDASVLRIYSDESIIQNYYKEVFVESVAEAGMTIAEHFPLDSFIDKVLSLQIDFKGLFLWNLIKRHKNRVGNEINEEIYKILGKLTDDITEQKTAEEKYKEFYGMDTVKKKMQEIVHSFAYASRREKLGLCGVHPPRVILFVGPPGTAKSQFASLLAQSLAERKFLKNGKVNTINASELQGQYLGEIPHKVATLFNDTISGSTLFLDEIYSIASDYEKNMYAKEALSQLCIELEKVALAQNTTKQLVILAGYGGTEAEEEQNLTKKFLEANPGIASRISTIVEFPSASANSATGIFQQIVKNHNYFIKEEEIEQIKEMLIDYFNTRVSQKNWGSGREARQIFTSAIKAAASRLAEKEEMEAVLEKELSILKIEDIAFAIEEVKSMHRSKSGKQFKMGYC